MKRKECLGQKRDTEGKDYWPLQPKWLIGEKVVDEKWKWERKEAEDQTEVEAATRLLAAAAAANNVMQSWKGKVEYD